MNKMIDCFKEDFTPRPAQTYILNQIQENLNKYDCFVINAPTGVGKSLIAHAVSNYFAREGLDSAIITSTKSLQDQYGREFPEIPLIKGKNNFKCDYLIDIKKVRESEDWNIQEYRKRGVSCNYGPCDKSRGNRDKVCQFKTEGRCAYYSQRDVALKSKRAVMNYPLLFSLMNNQVEGVDRYCMIYDEAHNLEDQLVNWATTSYTNTQLAELNINVDVSKLDDDRDGVLDLLEQVIAKSREFADNSHDNTVKQGYLDIEQKAKSIAQSIMMEPDHFLFYSEKRGYLDFALKITPTKVHKVAQMFLCGAKQFFLSATVTKDIINSELGIPMDRICEIQTNDHPFPLENRKVNYLDTAKVTYANFKQNPADQERCILKLQDIARKHPDERGLILLTRKSDLALMRKWIDRDVTRRFIEGHGTNEDGSTMDDAVKKLENSKNGILVSASAWEGIDLKDDLARWYVIYKMPWGDLGDKRIKNMKNLDHRWYGQKCVTKLIQGLGRCIRSKTDHAAGYCVDSGIKTGLRQNIHLVPKAYKDMF